MGSPSLQNYPACDTEVASVAGAMWQGIDGSAVPSGSYGAGRIFRSGDLAGVLGQLGTAPDLSDDLGLTGSDLLYLHRRTDDADIYFLSNQTQSPLAVTASFRVSGKAVELWDAVTGVRKPIATYQIAGDRTTVPLSLDAQQSVFVVFRGQPGSGRIVKLEKDGRALMDLTAATQATEPAPSTFTTSIWVKPATATAMPAEAKTGFQELYTTRADVIFPTQGQVAFGDGHAGSGFVVGTNGVVAYEHGAQYFAPILACPVSINAWTHLAIVYDHAQTKLYLNGTLVHIGLKSDFIVHPGDPNVTFNGKISSFRRINKALNAAEIADVMRQSGPGGAPGNLPALPLELTASASGLAGYQAWQSGTYTVQTADGVRQDITVGSSLAAIPVEGSWDLRLPAGSGATASFTLPLASLTENSNPVVKYFSGTATYSKTLQVPTGTLGAGRRLFLDLGYVGSMAQVILNGKDLGTLWAYPFRLDISQVAKEGANQLQVKVTNAWHNRLVGQQLSPASFSSAEALWASSMPGYSSAEPLIESGLIGPVQLLPALVEGAVPSTAANPSAKVGVFTGGDPGEGLDLSGQVVQVLNLGGDGVNKKAPDLSVAGVTFKDAYNGANLVPGVSVWFQTIDNWSTKAAYANATQNDRNLAELMWDVAHGAGIANEYPAVLFSSLQPNHAYSLQILASDADANPNRSTTYELYSGGSRSGVLQDSVTDINLTALQQASGGPAGSGVVVTLYGFSDKNGNLYFCSPDGVVPSGTSGAFDPNGIVSAVVLKDLGAASPFASWISSLYPSLSESDRQPDADPDHDGVSNFMEFALAGDPMNPSDRGLVAGVVQDASLPVGKELTLVFATRRGAVFSGPTSTVDGVIYTVQGSPDLSVMTAAVSETGSAGNSAPAQTGFPGLLGTAWEYHTFKLDGSDGLPGKGFMKVKIDAEVK